MSLYENVLLEKGKSESTVPRVQLVEQKPRHIPSTTYLQLNTDIWSFTANNWRVQVGPLCQYNNFPCIFTTLRTMHTRYSMLCFSRESFSM